MKTNIIKKIALCTLSFVILSFGMTGCKDYLTEIEPGTTLLEDFYTSTPALVQNVTACYTPLLWEYNSGSLSI